MSLTPKLKKLPGSLSDAMFEAEAEFLAPGTQSVATFSRLCIDRGEGALLYDLDGNRYIDLLAGVGVASLGYAHPRISDADGAHAAETHDTTATTQPPRIP